MLDTYHTLWPTHAFAEEQQFVFGFNVTLELGAIGCTVDVAAVIALPLFQVLRTQKCVVQSRHVDIRFARVECFVISREIVHLNWKYNRYRHFENIYILKPSVLLLHFVLSHTYPIDQADFVEVNPIGQKLIAQCC